MLLALNILVDLHLETGYSTVRCSKYSCYPRGLFGSSTGLSRLFRIMVDFITVYFQEYWWRVRELVLGAMLKDYC